MPDWNSITKIVLYICMAIVVIFAMKSCEIDVEVVAKCKQACSGLGNNLKYVNSRSCECSGEGIKESQSIWMLGR